MFDTIKDEILQEVKELVGEDFEGVYVDIANIEKQDYNYRVFLDAALTRTLSLGKNYRLGGGASKIVIVPKRADYVIKIPITGTYITKQDENGNEVRELEGHVDLTEFDHLEREQSIYQILNSGSKKVFLPNITVGEINDIPIYIQEKVEKTFGQINNPAEKFESSMNSAKKIVNQTSYGSQDGIDALDDAFIAAIVEYYGEDVARQVIVDAGDIGDLHEDNYGFTVDGRPVIFDYADFFCEMYCY